MSDVMHMIMDMLVARGVTIGVKRKDLSCFSIRSELSDEVWWVTLTRVYVPASAKIRVLMPEIANPDFDVGEFVEEVAGKMWSDDFRALR